MNTLTNEVRTPAKIFFAVISALFVQQLRAKFIKSANTRRSIAITWVVLEPMVHVAIWIGLRGLYGLKNTDGLDPVVFILLGALPFLLFSKTLMKSVSAIKSNRSLYQYRQIKPISVLCSALLLESTISILVYIILFTLCWWFNFEWNLYYPLFIILNFISFVITALGLSIILAVVGFFFRFVQNFSMVITRILYFTSGVFYPISSIPKQYLFLFTYNPLFQFIEISRESFRTKNLHVNVADPVYLFQFAIFALFFGLILYVSTRKKIMTDINQI